MFTPLILFLGLTVATAVIAHWSDNLGKKLGKKRVSLFGLRPRTTATVLTVASSWAIMLFTLGALLLTAAPLRKALFSYDLERAQAQIDREQAKAQIETARNRLKETQNQFDKSSGQLKQAQLDLRKADQLVRKSREAARKAREQGKRAEEIERKRAEDARKRANRAEKEADEAQKRVVEAQKRVVGAQKRVVGAQKRFQLAQRETQAAQGETQAAQRETQKFLRLTEVANRNFETARANLKSTEAQLKTREKQLKRTQGALKRVSASKAVARSNLYDVSNRLLVREEQLKGTERQLIATEQQLAERRQLALAFASQALAFASTDAPIKVGQTFAARILDSDQKPEVIAAKLRELVTQGQEFLTTDEELAAKLPPDATLQLLPLSAQDAAGKPVLLAGEQLLRRFARDIAANPRPAEFSIRLVAPRNFLATESKIEAIFAAVEIKPAFAKGEILASSTIDGTQHDALIFNSLLELTNLGRQRAESLGVNPPQSPDEQFFYAAGTNRRIFEALRVIERSKSRLRVNLVAFKALSTVEPLQVRFEIEGALAEPGSGGSG